MMKTSLALSFALSLSSGSLTASAQPSATGPADSAPGEQAPADRRDGSSLSAVVGVFAPTGSIGFEYAHTVSPHVELGAGAGLGYVLMAAFDDSSPAYSVAPQLAVMPRLRMRRGPLKLTAGAGLSLDLGLQEGGSPFEGGMYIDRWVALVANAEIGAQIVSRTGWFGGLSVGASTVVAASAGETDPAGSTHMRENPVGTTLPFIGLRFGRTL